MKAIRLPKIDSRKLTKGLFREAAPGLLSGYIVEKVRDIPAIEGYHYLMAHDLWDLVPEDKRQWVLGVRPWGLSEWMSIDWLFKTLMSSNPPLATLLATSQKFRDRMTEQIESLIDRLDKNTSQ